MDGGDFLKKKMIQKSITLWLFPISEEKETEEYKFYDSEFKIVIRFLNLEEM